MVPGLALLLAVALGADTRVETGVRTEARARRFDPAPTPAQKDSIDISATPHLILRLTGGLGSLSATYAPRLTASDLGPDLGWERMHEGELRLQLAPGPVWSLEAFASGGAGRTDLLTENRTAATRTGAGTGTGTGTGTNTISTIRTVDLERVRTGLSFRAAPGRRTELLLSGAVSEDGGTNARSRIALPVARAAEAGAELRWRATRLDQLGLRLAAAQARIAAHRTDSAWASALGTWRHRLAPDVELWTGAGAVMLQSRVPEQGPPPQPRTTSRETRPAGELGLARTSGQQEVTGEVAGTVGASVDRLTGAATPQLDLRSNLRWPLTSSVALVWQGTSALAWPDTGRTRRGQLELGASFTVGPRTLVDLGAYGAWQNSTDPAVPDLSEYGAFLSLALDAPPLTF